jgi:hypothetical protein
LFSWGGKNFDFFFIFNTFLKLFLILAPKLFYFIPNTFGRSPTQGSDISTLSLPTWRSGKVADVAVGVTRA